ncbi:hypothetical protein [Reichenbachiella sp.]|uniref:hypothetical protein n=1 Tax=Reichenbachiella sp. TaxID=2184521 RepID=UPI003BB18AC6
MTKIKAGLYLFIFMALAITIAFTNMDIDEWIEAQLSKKGVTATIRGTQLDLWSSEVNVDTIRFAPSVGTQIIAFNLSLDGLVIKDLLLGNGFYADHLVLDSLSLVATPAKDTLEREDKYDHQ